MVPVETHGPARAQIFSEFLDLVCVSRAFGSPPAARQTHPIHRRVYISTLGRDPRSAKSGKNGRNETPTLRLAKQWGTIPQLGRPPFGLWPRTLSCPLAITTPTRPISQTEIYVWRAISWDVRRNVNTN